MPCCLLGTRASFPACRAVTFSSRRPSSPTTTDSAPLPSSSSTISAPRWLYRINRRRLCTFRASTPHLIVIGWRCQPCRRGTRDDQSTRRSDLSLPLRFPITSRVFLRSSNQLAIALKAVASGDQALRQQLEVAAINNSTTTSRWTNSSQHRAISQPAPTSTGMPTADLALRSRASASTKKRLISPDRAFPKSTSAYCQSATTPGGSSPGLAIGRDGYRQRRRRLDPAR